MPAKKSWKKPECEVLLLIKSTEISGRPSSKGLNFRHLRLVRWFKGEPKLENRHMFFHEESGEWRPMKNLPFGPEDWDYIVNDPQRRKTVDEIMHRVFPVADSKK